MLVSAAVFRRKSSVMLMRRAENQPCAGGWEYPGGKFEPGESGADCMRRELREELGINVTDMKFLTSVSHVTDSGKVIELHVYEILAYNGKITLNVHDMMHWVDMADLVSHPQLPADLLVSEYLVNNWQ